MTNAQIQEITPALGLVVLQYSSLEHAVLDLVAVIDGVEEWYLLDERRIQEINPRIPVSKLISRVESYLNGYSMQEINEDSWKNDAEDGLKIMKEYSQIRNAFAHGSWFCDMRNDNFDISLLTVKKLNIEGKTTLDFSAECWSREKIEDVACKKQEARIAFVAATDKLKRKYAIGEENKFDS